MCVHGILCEWSLFLCLCVEKWSLFVAGSAVRIRVMRVMMCKAVVFVPGRPCGSHPIPSPMCF